MPAERTVSCPACGAERQTRAGGGTRLTCTGCRKAFRAPAVEAPPAASSPPEPAVGAGGVKVQKATATKVRQTARPRTPTKEGGDEGSGSDGKPASAPAASGEGVTSPEGDRPELEPPGQQKVEPTPDPISPGQRRAQVLGRRGGRGYYASRVRARADR